MQSPSRFWMGLAATAATAALAAPGGAQDALDRADAAVASQDAEITPVTPNGATEATVARDGALASALGEAVEVSAIVVDGAPSIPPATFLPATEPFLGRALSPADLRELATKVADVMRRRGYVFSSAWIAPQSLSGRVLRINADEGRIDRIRMRGDERPAVERALSPLTDGNPVTGAELQRALLIAGDLPGMTVRDSRYDQVDGRGVLSISSAQQRVTGYASLDNFGSGSAGPIRLRGRVSVNDVLGADELTLRTTVTPLDPRELATLGGEYSAVIHRSGTVASLSGSITRVRAGERYRRLDLDSRSISANLGLMHPVRRSAEASLWANLDLSIRDSEQDRAGALSRDDRVASLNAGLYGFKRLGEGWLSGRVTVRQGLDVLGATEVGDPLASRRDGDGVFTKGEAYVEWTGIVAPRVGLKLAAEGQLASRPLLSSEEFGIGGQRFGRAYDFSERRGDQGVAGLAEVHYKLKGDIGPADDVQVYAFVDGGRVDDLRRERAGGLASAGGGVRFDLGRRLDAELELAAPLGRERFETGDRSPRLNFALSARF